MPVEQFESLLEYCNSQHSLLNGGPKEGQALMSVYSLFNQTPPDIWLRNIFLVDKTIILVLIELTVYRKLSKFSTLSNGPID